MKKNKKLQLFYYNKIFFFNLKHFILKLYSNIAIIIILNKIKLSNQNSD
jgi:hypothetical protein